MTSNVLSVSMNLTISDVCYKWNHTIFLDAWLILFSITFFKVHPCYNMYQNFTFFLIFIYLERASAHVNREKGREGREEILKQTPC